MCYHLGNFINKGINMSYYTKVITLIILIHTSLFANNFRGIKTFEASFIQTIENPSGNKVNYNGILYIKEPNKIKWEYKTPIEKIVYINKNLVTIIEPELEQAITTKIDQEINILNLLKNAKKITDYEYQSKFNNITYTLSIENNKLQQIKYQDEIENNVIIRFTDVKQDHMINSEIFLFTIPYDYDIIKK